MTERKFAIGDLVAYGINGICTIENIEMMSMVTDMPEMPYYVLKPENSDSSTVYIPVGNDKLVSKMRRVMTRDEIREMVVDSKDKEIEWDNDRRYRNEQFHSILADGVHQEMILMIDCIHKRKEKLTETGKKLPATDSNILKQAEKLVVEEFSHVLDIEPRDVSRYIRTLREDDYEDKFVLD